MAILPVSGMEGQPLGNNAAAEAQRQEFKWGEQVEYWSSTYTMYMNAVVQKVNMNENGIVSYDLDIKSKAAYRWRRCCRNAEARASSTALAAAAVAVRRKPGCH